MNKKLLLTIALLTGTAAQAAQPLSNGVKAALATGASAFAAAVYASTSKTVIQTAPTPATTVVQETQKQIQTLSTSAQAAIVAALCCGVYATYKTAQWLFGSNPDIDAIKSQIATGCGHMNALLPDGRRIVYTRTNPPVVTVFAPGSNAGVQMNISDLK